MVPELTSSAGAVILTEALSSPLLAVDSELRLRHLRLCALYPRPSLTPQEPTGLLTSTAEVSAGATSGAGRDSA